jgi:hypothetical protein
MTSTIENSTLNYPIDSWGDGEDELTLYSNYIDENLIRKYVKEIGNRKIDDSFNNTFDSFSNDIDKYWFISKIVVKLQNLDDINYLMKNININFWIICLESLEHLISQMHPNYYQDIDKCENTLSNLETTLNIYSYSIFDIFSVNDFCKSHKTFIIDTMKKLEYINYNYNKNVCYVNNILQKFMNNCFNITIWESYLRLIFVKDSILEYLDNPKFIWIFYQISVDTTIDLFEYYLNINITESDNRIKRLRNFYKLFKILFNKYKKYRSKMTY